jgi:hypothetical protein
VLLLVTHFIMNIAVDMYNGSALRAPPCP